LIDQEKIKTVDKDEMLSHIIEFPQQLQKGWNIGVSDSISLKLTDIDSIVFSGMGGSAIAGDLVKGIFEKMPVPFVVNRSYSVPDFMNTKTLFIASSYSGNTEETITALKKAIKRKSHIVCITSGGKVESIGHENHFSVYKIEKGYPPRAALGFNLGILISMLKKMGLNTISSKDIKKTVRFLTDTIQDWKELSCGENVPLHIAEKIKGRIPLIYGSINTCSAVALRWKTQLNENSKTHAFSQPFSEMNHNEIMGWEVLSDTKQFFSNLCAVFLRTENDYDRDLYRMDITRSLIEDSGVDIVDITAEGFSLFSRLMYLVLLGDFVSFYLAVLYGVDPTVINKIDLLKKQLNN